MKVEHDLDVFVESIVEGENRLRRGDTSHDMQELVRNLQEMKPKIEDLCLKLSSAGEYEAGDKARASGRKLVAFLEAHQNSQRQGFSQGQPQGQGSSAISGGFGLQGPAQQGWQQTQPQTQHQTQPQTQHQSQSQASNGFFSDFSAAGAGNSGSQAGAQTVSFDNFNQFSQQASPAPQPKSQGGADFWAQATGSQQPVHQPQPQTGGFFEQHFDGGASGNFTTGSHSGLPKSGGDFFDGFGGQPARQPQTYAPQRPQSDDLNLLGLDPPGQSSQAGQPGKLSAQGSYSNAGGLDLLGMSAGQTGQPQAAQSHHGALSNPFGPGSQGGVQQQLIAQPQQYIGQQQFGGQPPQFSSQQQSGGQPQQFSSQQQFGGQHQQFSGQPQQFSGHPQQYGQPQQHTNSQQFGVQQQALPSQSQGFGSQAHGNFLAGGQMSNGFGASAALYTADAYKAATDKRNQVDPFGDLTNDLV